MQYREVSASCLQVTPRCEGGRAKTLTDQRLAAEVVRRPAPCRLLSNGLADDLPLEKGTRRAHVEGPDSNLPTAKFSWTSSALDFAASSHAPRITWYLEHDILG